MKEDKKTAGSMDSGKIVVPVSRDKNKDTGLVVLLVLAWLYFRTGEVVLLQAAVLLLFVTLLLPVVLTPLTRVLHGFSERMGLLVFRAMLAAVFFCIVTPVGILRRLTRQDRLLMQRWKKGRESVFAHRNRQFSSTDLEHLF